MTFLSHTREVRVEDGFEAANQPGVLVIAAWFDHDGHRARLTFTGRVGDDQHESVVVAGREEILSHVAGWLDDVGRGSNA